MNIGRILRTVLRKVPLLWAFTLFGCSNLPELSPDVCGNYVIDNGEDCDRYAESPHLCAGPGEEFACHYTCRALGPTCPSGYGCDTDGLCRSASKEFVSATAAEGYVWPTALKTGDFDSDGNGDLLLLGPIDSDGYRPARALFSQGFSLHTGLGILPTELANPAIGAGSGDGSMRDIAFANFEGVALLRGYPDRNADYAVFPTISLPDGAHVRAVMADALPQKGRDEFVAVMTMSDGASDLLGVESGAPPVALVPVPGGEKELVEMHGLSSANFDETIPCGQIVLAYANATKVDLYTPCKNTGGTFSWNVGGLVDSITLQPIAKIDRGVLAKDIDADGHLDLVIGASNRTYVAYGLGNGKFRSQMPNGSLNEAAPYDLPSIAGGSPGFPLDIADLNADGRPDFVMDDGIVLSKNADFQYAYSNHGALWSEAVIANLNANDWPDVATVAAGSLDIHFFNNAGGGLFGEAVLPTEGSPNHLSVGDFDGDLLNDLVFSEAIADHGELSDHLSFAFGAPFGHPAFPVSTGEVGKLGQIVTGHIDDSAGSDPMTEIGVVIEGKEERSDSFALLPGRASRAIFSTLPLRPGPVSHLPVSLAFGRFGDITPDIVALAINPIDGRLSLFRIEAFDEEGLMIPDSSDPLPSSFKPADDASAINLRYGAIVVAVDLEKDNVDEAVVVGAYADNQHGAFAVAKYDVSGEKFNSIDAQVFDGEVTNDSTMFVDDLDGDGNQDIVLTTGTLAAPSDLLVVWGDGSGNMPPLNEALKRTRIYGLGVKAVTALRSPRAKGKMLLASTLQKTYLLELTKERSWEPVEIPAIGAARSFAVIDFDHDGVEDVAAQLEGGLELFRSVPN